MKTTQVLAALGAETSGEVYYCGPYVRDVARKKKPLRITTIVRNLSTKKLIRYLEQRGKITIINKRRPLIIFSADDDVEAIITFPSKGRRTSPLFSLKEDSYTHGFTINAMYAPLKKKKARGKVIDFHKGLQDVKARRIRTIKEPKQTLRADPTKILEAIALSAGLGYTIDEDLYLAIKVTRDLIKKIPSNKIRECFIAIVMSRKPSKYLKMMHELGVLSYVLPELDVCWGVTQNEQYHKHDVFTHCVLSCDNAPQDLVVKLAALLHDVGKAETRAEKDDGKLTFYGHETAGSRLSRRALHRFGMNRDIVVKVSDLIYNHMYNYEPAKWTDAAVRRFIRKINLTASEVANISNHPLFLLRRAERLSYGRNMQAVSQRQKNFERRITDIYESSMVFGIDELAITGTDIMEAFNLKQGPTIGHVLNYLLSLVTEDPELNTKDTLREAASRYLSEALK